MQAQIEDRYTLPPQNKSAAEKFAGIPHIAGGYRVVYTAANYS